MQILTYCHLEKDVKSFFSHHLKTTEGTKMNWLYLLLASILEIGWVISLKYTEGFTKTIPLIFYGFFGFTSAYCFSNSLKTIPMGLAYSIWTAIAIVGTTIAEVYMYKRPVDYTRMFFMLLIISGVIGLKLSGTPVTKN